LVPAISFRQLLEQFTATMERSGATVLLVGNNNKPARLRVVSGESSTDCIVYLWTITPGGGGPGVRPANERRIQITNAPPFPLTPGTRTIVGGWNPEAGVWAFWDARRHTRFSTRSPSFQTTAQTLEVAGHNGIATHVRPANEGREVTVAVRPDFLLWYVQDGQMLHDIDEDAAEVATLIDGTPEEETEIVESSTTPEQLGRRVQLVELMRAFRDARFRPLVLQAYGSQCAVCGTALKLVDAAHIVPVSDPRGDDVVNNGLALCRLHHGAYDTGLMGVQSNYGIVLNPAAANRLRQVHLDGGLDAFSAALPATIRLPNVAEVRPDPQKLRIGLEVRQFPLALVR
jgi:putative restriction endonuclease